LTQPARDDLIAAEGVAVPPQVLTTAEEAEPSVCPAPPAATVGDSAPTTLGRFLLDSEIGRGGMGCVFRGRDRELERDLAVKVLLPRHQGRPEMERRFLEEARIAGRLEHPGVPAVHELGRAEDGRPYFAMKLIKGRTLAELLKDRPSPASDLPRFLGVFEQVCQTLAYAHAHGVLHRDLKPANVMVGKFGEVQVMDWGLAKVLGERWSAGEEGTATPASVFEPTEEALSHAGTVLGTPSYMAPEQARGQIDKLDERADVFGLGAILCEVLTGAPPFARGASSVLIRRAARGEVGDALSRLDGCGADAELVALAKACLAAEAADRPRHAGEVAAQVAAYRAGVEQRLQQAEVERAAAEARIAADRRQAEAERKRRRAQRWLIAALLGLLALAGVGGWYLDRHASQRRLEQEQQEAERRQAATQALDAAEQGLGKESVIYGEVEAALTQAERRLGEAGPDDLRQRLAGLRQDLAMLRGLDRIAEKQFGRQFSREREEFVSEVVKLEYAAEFRAHGLPVGGRPAEELAERVRRSPIRAALLDGLDLWLDAEPHNVTLAEVLRRADPDEQRNRIREALRREGGFGRYGSLRPDGRLLSQELYTVDPAQLSPGLAMRIGRGGTNYGSRFLGLIQAVWRQRPNHFLLAYRCGELFLADKRDGEAVGFYRAALASRPDSAAAYRGLGSALLSQKDLDGALVCLRKAVELDPKCAAAHGELVRTFQARGKSEEAASCYRRAVELAGADARALVDLGMDFRRYGPKDYGLGCFRKAVELDGRYARHLASALREQNLKDEAVVWSRRAVELDPSNCDVHLNLGFALGAQNDLDGALACFRKAVELDPKDAEALSVLLDALKARGKLDEADACSRKALEASRDDAPFLDDLGKILEQRKQPEMAAACFQRALELRPGDLETTDDLARILKSLGRLDDALGCLRKAVAARPNDARAHAELGGWLLNSGVQIDKSKRILKNEPRIDEALACLRKAVELDPKNLQAQFGLSLVLWIKGQAAEAEAHLGVFVDLVTPVLGPKLNGLEVAFGVMFFVYYLEGAGWEEGAMSIPRKLIERFPDNAPYHHILGEVLQRKKDLDGAIAAYRTALQLDPKLAESWEKLVEVLQAKGDRDGALAAYRAALALLPAASASLHNRVGLALSDKGRLDEAIICFREAIAAKPTFAQAHANLGWTLWRNKDLDGAIASYRQATEIDPKNALFHHSLGRALRAKGDLDGAIAAFRKAIEIDPKNPWRYQELGFALNQKRDVDGAIAAYRKAIEINPKDARAYNILGFELKVKGDLDGAIAAYRKAIEIDPKDAQAYNNVGNILKDKGDVDGAIATYRKAIEIDPKETLTYINLGSTLTGKGDVDGAIACYRKAIEIDPKLASLHNLLGTALRNKGDVDGAIACYRRLIEIEPKNPSNHLSLGSTLASTLTGKGDVDGAIAAFRKAIELDPKDTRAYNLLGLALMNKRDLDGAIAAYRKAIEIDPKSAAFPANLGMVLSQQGDLEGAEAAFRKALELNPNNAWTRSMLERFELRGKLPAFLKGDYRPADNKERLALFWLCSRGGKSPRAAARLYAEAFAEDPKLADLQAHRYDAACCSALAAAGKGEGAADLDDKERARLRRQALDWLRADLAQRQKQAEGDKAADRAAVHATLTHWQKDADLAAVRDQAALYNLPEAERKEWQQFWADVADLLKAAGG
jgi:tetratricopeptide (TPR) repeat protein/tRNA A-37 threonylcarbamoyl transferase component Bud32